MSNANDDNNPECNPSERRPDAVGHKRPPKHTQFQPGRSGNPNGRPRGSVDLRARVSKELRQIVTVTIKGKVLKMTKADVIARQLVDAATKGDLKATLVAMRLDDEIGLAAAEAVRADETQVTPDKANLKFIYERMRGLIGEDK